MNCPPISLFSFLIRVYDQRFIKPRSHSEGSTAASAAALLTASAVATTTSAITATSSAASTFRRFNGSLHLILSGFTVLKHMSHKME